MANVNQIKEHMPVFESTGRQFGTVDNVEGNFIKLTRDNQGQHHWIPMDWVTQVEDRVMINLDANQAMKQWLNNRPQGTQQGRMGTQDY